MLSLRDIVAGYVETNPVINGLNLTVNSAEVVGVLGQNGCGKSTLAKAILGLAQISLVR